MQDPEVNVVIGSASLAAHAGTPGRKILLWDSFCQDHDILSRGVPLFEVGADGSVVIAPYGDNGRLVLRRSEAMTDLLASEVERVLASPASGDGSLEGVLYMMHWRDGERVVPLYIGRAGRYGRNGKVSANLFNIRSNPGFFARWGSNYAYHIGDLSAVVCPGHAAGKVTPKYTRWASRLFVEVPSGNPTLRQPVYFWATAWGPMSRGIWQEYGSCSLSFQEYLLIGVASDLFPGVLLNDEGVNRAGEGGTNASSASTPVCP